jgi:hypothetical protein
MVPKRGPDGVPKGAQKGVESTGLSRDPGMGSSDRGIWGRIQGYPQKGPFWGPNPGCQSGHGIAINTIMVIPLIPSPPTGGVRGHGDHPIGTIPSGRQSGCPNGVSEGPKWGGLMGMGSSDPPDLAGSRGLTELGSRDGVHPAG